MKISRNNNQLAKIGNKNSGFTILEIIVSIVLFTVIIILVSSIYSLSQKSYNKGSNQGELSQNARVALDRMSREIRQSASIVTNLPETDNGPANPDEIFFQDGHNISQITYLKYYLNGNDLMREHKTYYFDEEPDTYVTWDSVDEFGDPPEELILESRIVGEYFNNLGFWGANGLVNIDIGLIKNQNILNVDTAVYSRNW